MEQESVLWEGKTCAEPKGPTADEVWPLLADFCNLHKWWTILDTCYQVEGSPGQPGLIRYCALYSDGFTAVKWAKEKLLTIDPIQRCLSYAIVENNMGFKSYVATMKVLPIDGPGDASCKIEWSFVCDPIEGWRLEDFLSFLGSTLQSMAKKMEDALQSTASTLT